MLLKEESSSLPVRGEALPPEGLATVKLVSQ